MGRTIKTIPDRWLEYEAVGGKIENTRFLPFKTPLRPSLTYASNQKFDVSILMRRLAQIHPDYNIGLIIDLTNTNRYYDSNEFIGMGIDYIKIKCPGHDVDRREDLVKKFIHAVDEYISEHQDDDTLIGVHCTHGINRTGFLICRYLIDTQNWSVEDATKAFEKGRGYAMERDVYLSALKNADLKRKSAIKTESNDFYYPHLAPITSSQFDISLWIPIIERVFLSPAKTSVEENGENGQNTTTTTKISDRGSSSATMTQLDFYDTEDDEDDEQNE